MKSRKGIFMAVSGVASIILSKSSIFFVESHPGLGIEGELKSITFLLVSAGITLLLVGTYQYTQAEN